MKKTTALKKIWFIKDDIENFNITPLPISKGQLICCFSRNLKSFYELFPSYFLKEKSHRFVRKIFIFLTGM